MVDDHRTLSHNSDENPIIYLIYHDISRNMVDCG